VIFYSHRGNTEGPVSARENSPKYIDEAIEKGFHVEIDLRSVNDRLLLGHDFPTYPVSLMWLRERKSSLLIHAKDLHVACGLSTLRRVEPEYDFTFFCHSTEPFVLMSNGLVWLHDMSCAYRMVEASTSYVLPLISMELVNTYPKQPNCAGVCSDFVSVLKEQWQ